MSQIAPYQVEMPCIPLHFIYIYISKGDEPPWSIDHRGLAFHYTAYIYIYIIYIYIYIYIYKYIYI